MPQPSPLFDTLLHIPLSMGVSDIHLREGSAVMVRDVRGDMVTLDGTCTPAQLDQFLELACTPAQRSALYGHGQADLAYVSSQGRRFRVNVYRERGHRAAVLRVLTEKVRLPEELGVPDAVTRLSTFSDGLVLVTGPTGSGMSSTLSSLIQGLNMREPLNIITIEESIELIYPQGRSNISQREIGTDASDFLGAVRASLRQDPDVVLIGEMRDKETADAAISLASTGHLVFSTLHTQDAVRTVKRVLEFYSHESRPGVQNALATSLRGVVCQRLLPSKDGQGRVLVTELMRVTLAVQDAINEGDLDKVRVAIEDGGRVKDPEMWLFDQALIEAVKANRISEATAREYAVRSGDINKSLMAIKGL